MTSEKRQPYTQLENAYSRLPITTGRQGGVSKNITKFMQPTQAENNGMQLKKNSLPGSQLRPEYKSTDRSFGQKEKESLVEKRGKAASSYIFREIIVLCEAINKHGRKNADGTASITFGEMFDLYTDYSGTLVGLLLRARKYGMLNFKGEMLYQHQDEKKIITLARPIQEIRVLYVDSGDPGNCVSKRS